MNGPGVRAKLLGSNPITSIASSPAMPPPFGVIGTAPQGPAFVPFDIANVGDMVKIFGTVGQENFGLLAAQQWLANGGASIVFVRTLGAGDGNPRTTSGNNPGRVQNAGFVVGQQIINTATNLVGSNPYAGTTAVVPGVLGRTYFLATLMSETNGSTIFSDAGIQNSETAQPILRGILFAPSGVVPSLYAAFETNNTATSTSAAIGYFGASGDGGAAIGTVDVSNAKQDFTLLLNGHVGTDEYPNTIAASFDINAINEDTSESKYFASVFNTDPTKIQEAGHYLYAHYDIPANFANLSGKNLINQLVDFASQEPLVFLLSATLGRDAGSSTNTSNNTIGVPNFENFEDRFSPAFTPFIISQKINGRNLDLFRFETVTDGVPSNNLKIVISDITPPASIKDMSCTFNVSVYNATATESEQPIQVFKNCSLDFSSQEFIEKKIGNFRLYYDFDATNDGDKVTSEGEYPLQNTYVRVIASDELKSGQVPRNALPVGFRGIYHLVTSGSSVSGATSILTGTVSSDALSAYVGIGEDVMRRVVQPPLSLRENLFFDSPANKKLNPLLTWGVQYTTKLKPTQPNPTNIISNFIDTSVFSQLKFFPAFHTSLQNPWVGNNAGTPDTGGCVLDADRFNNNYFTLENILVITGSAGTTNTRDIRLPDEKNFAAASYRRNGKNPGSLEDIFGNSSDKVRFVDPEFDLKDSLTRSVMKFTVPFMGGFDGLNIFDQQKVAMTDWAVKREYTDPNQFGKKGSTTAAYLKAIEVMKEKQGSDPQIIAIPGIRHRSVIDQLVAAAEDRFDAMGIIDVEQYDSSGNYVTGSLQDPDVFQTADQFFNRFIGSSFAAAYFPDVTLSLTPAGQAQTLQVGVPPTVAAAAAIATNDSTLGTFGAPMGAKRGVVAAAIDTNVEFNSTDIDKIISSNFNPIVKETNAAGNVKLASQKTTYGNQNLFDRINIRRLTIDIRRRVRNIARNYLFERIDTGTIGAFRLAIISELQKIQNAGGIQEFQVILDNTGIGGSKSFSAYIEGAPSKQLGADFENNILRGKVIIIPVAANEMVEIDFKESPI